MAPSDLHAAKPLPLKCGLVLPNRLAKAALAERLCGEHYLPNEKLFTLYKPWAEGGWGMILTGNVHVNTHDMGVTGDCAVDPTIPESTIVAAWTQWSRTISAHGAPAIMQLNHPGRQALAGARWPWEKNVAPSAVPLNPPGWLAQAACRFAFGVPRALEVHEIEQIVAQFAKAARLAAESGFAGVEIHAAHGYLLAQFMSGRSNVRTDAYGGTARKRAKMAVDIIRAVRRVVPEGFAVGMKLNSVDHQSKEELEGCIEQLELIVEAGLDFLEISGGTYEDPAMMLGNKDDGVEKEQQSERSKAREAFFLDFARAIRSRFPDQTLMVTGGFRSRQGMEAALANGDCDLIGLGRPPILNPSMPANLILNSEIKDEDARAYAKKIEQPHWLAQWLFGAGIRFMGAGLETSRYQAHMKKFVNGAMSKATGRL